MAYSTSSGSTLLIDGDVRPKPSRLPSGSTFLVDGDVRLVARTVESKEEGEQEGLVEWVRKGLVGVTIDGAKASTDILTVSLHLPATPVEIDSHLEGVTVVASNRQFIVLCTGPKSYAFSSSGHYLVYDTCKKELHLVPPIGMSGYMELFGRVPVIMASHTTFVLAPLLFAHRTKKYSMFVYTFTENDWVRKDVCLPKDVSEYPFMTDIGFPIMFNSYACWADLKLGIVICNLYGSNPDDRFVPLPEGYQMDFFPMARGRPNIYSTVGFINGQFKLVYMDGYSNQDFPRDQITISMWSYEANFLGIACQSEWVRDHGTPLRVTDLWADMSFRAVPDLPKRPPMCPTLSLSDPNMVYFFSSDLAYVDGHIATKGEHVFCLNMQSKTVQSWTKCPPGRSCKLIPSLIPIELKFPNQDDQL